MKKILNLAIFVAALSIATIAQDNIGLATGNFSGIHGAFLNPAEIANSKLYLDLNLLSGNLFFHNNYIRILPQRENLNQNMGTIGVLVGSVMPGLKPPTMETLDKYTTEYKHGYSNFRLTGPSIIYSFRKHAFAFHTSFRAHASVLAAPYDIAKFSYVGLHFSPQHHINYIHPNRVTGVSAGWTEFGFVYANTLRQDYNQKITAGITMKGLLGYHGIYMHSTNASYMIPDRDTIHIYHLDAIAGLSMPVDYNNNDFFGIKNPVRGTGFAMDLGITYSRLSDKRWRKIDHLKHHYSPYVFRIGLSLIDMGMIHFNKHSRRLLFDINDTITWGGLAGIDFINTNHYIDTMSLALTNDKLGLDDGTSFNIFLPSAAVLQIDYNINNTFYANLVWVHNISYTPIQVSRPSYIAITPRYEKDRLGISMPLTLFRYREPRLGLAIRFYNFTIGTSKLGTFFGSSDFNGFSFYFSVKYSLLKVKFKRDRWNCHEL
ncbi:MAG: DUF5723 family protein [Bacteroidales bacterium]|nr:DUF5723 family protein [Bacteroidales bacterium]MDZ4204940.1 DUF5723 family protein [Bacteroidales bacterium]